MSFLEVLFMIGQSAFECLIAFVKAFIPLGVLPRKDVKGQVVLVTGAGSGLGRLTAVQFAQLGAKVVLWDINTKGNEETKLQIQNDGGTVYAFTVNLANRDEIYAVAKEVEKTVGHVDIIVNNAGVVTGKSLLESPDTLIELTMAVNTTALLWTTKAFLPAMLERNHGHICTIASMAGKVGCSKLVDYCASKHGAVGFHEALSGEIFRLEKLGIKTTVICPYFIDTGMFAGVSTKFPFLLPILEPDYVVDNILEGILTDRHTVCIPKFGYVIIFFASFLPVSVMGRTAKLLGFDVCMDTFEGRH